jgi:hypothetical protein
MSHHSPEQGRHQVAAVVVGLTTLLTVLLVAFAWPPSELAPRDLPIAVAGPPDGADQVASTIDRVAGDGAFDVAEVTSRDAAVAAVEDREVYGAVVLSPSGPETLVASAASPVVAQMLTELGSGIAEKAGTPPVVTDVVPAPEADPRGVVFGAGALPVVIGGIAAGVALALRVTGRRQQLVAGLGAAVASGLAMAAVQQYWFDALAGSFWANAGVYSLTIGAMAAVVVGMHRALGLPGLGLTAATFVLLGNPLSGITTAPELLPDGWSTLGQLLPPGAFGSALRSTAFFDGAGALAPLMVLGAWLAVGLVLAALPARQAAGRRTPARVDHEAKAPQPA